MRMTIKQREMSLNTYPKGTKNTYVINMLRISKAVRS